MRLFDVLGPVMIGPSSSHTAGAARIGYTAQKLLGEIPAQADIGLYGSFATTGKGHGTDKPWSPACLACGQMIPACPTALPWPQSRAWHSGSILWNCALRTPIPLFSP